MAKARIHEMAREAARRIEANRAARRKAGKPRFDLDDQEREQVINAAHLLNTRGAMGEQAPRNRKFVYDKKQGKVVPVGEETPDELATRTYKKPVKSDLLSCLPSQAKEFNEKSKLMGNVGVSYDEQTGIATCSSRAAKVREMKLRGIGNASCY